MAAGFIARHTVVLYDPEMRVRYVLRGTRLGEDQRLFSSSVIQKELQRALPTLLGNGGTVEAMAQALWTQITTTLAKAGVTDRVRCERVILAPVEGHEVEYGDVL